MAKKGKPDYHGLHKKLKTLGVLGGNLKKSEKYSASEKKRISTLYNKFSREADWATKPHRYKDSQRVVTFSARELKTKKEIKLAREAGQIVYGNKILIKHYTNQTVRLVRAKTHLSKGKPVLQIEKREGKITRREQIATRLELLQFLEEMGKQRVSKNSPYNKVTVKIGDNNPFASTHLKYEDLLKYITNTGERGKGWELTDVAGATEYAIEQKRYELINLMTIVYIK